tara:strand:+ start:301 stop:999 length:699 start_codon:yes stop_codon:yes gene_type:complete
MDEFARLLIRLSQEYGYEEVLDELGRQLGADFSDAPPLDLEEEPTTAVRLPLQENPLVRGAATPQGKAAIGAAATGVLAKGKAIGKWIMDKAAQLGLYTTAAVTGATTRAAGGALSRAYDQDVRLADQASDLVLRVTNPTLEDLMKKTNELLALMAGQTAQDLEQLDLSMDHVAAGLTGKSVRDVQGMQATGGVPRITPAMSDLTGPATVDALDDEPDESEDKKQQAKPKKT